MSGSPDPLKLEGSKVDDPPRRAASTCEPQNIPQTSHPRSSQGSSKRERSSRSSQRGSGSSELKSSRSPRRRQDSSEQKDHRSSNGSSRSSSRHRGSSSERARRSSRDKLSSSERSRKSRSSQSPKRHSADEAQRSRLSSGDKLSSSERSRKSRSSQSPKRHSADEAQRSRLSSGDKLSSSERSRKSRSSKSPKRQSADEGASVSASRDRRNSADGASRPDDRKGRSSSDSSLSRNRNQNSHSKSKSRSRDNSVDSMLSIGNMGVLSEDEEMHLNSDDGSFVRKDTETKKSSSRRQRDGTSRGNSDTARNPGLSSVQTVSNTGPAENTNYASDTLIYGSDADAKAKARSKYGGSTVAANRGVESVSLPAIPTATVVDEIGIVEDLSIGRTDSESASNSDPPPRSTNGRQDTQPEVMDIERVTVVPNDPELTSSRRSSSDQNTTGGGRKPKRSRKKRIALLLFFLLLVGGGIAIWLFLFKNKKDHQDSRIGSSNLQGPTSVPSSSTVSSEPPSGVGAWTTSPTKSPFIEGLLFQPPTEDNCEAIAKNETIAGREEMEDADFGLGLEVVLSGESTMTQPLVYELLSAIQEKILPSLAGCNINLDEFVEDWRFVIFDAFVSGNVQPGERCKDENLATQNCHLMAIQLDLFLKGRVRFLDIIDLISDEEVNIANHLGLTDVFSIVKLVQIDNLTPTSSPTIMPSDVPSWTPSKSPTGQGTAKPTLLPTARPTSRGTGVPTGSPIAVPTLAPSVVSATALPVANPSPATTDLPTSSPSKTPSSVPSSLPSKTPSATPSESPSALPSSEPSTVPSTRPSSVPSGSPSTTPSALPSTSPSNVPSISPSTTPSMQPSIASFYWVTCGKSGGCRNKNATVQNANYMFLEGIPSDRRRDEIAVRCCSETKLLGFHGPRAESCPFADSDIGGINGCYNTTTYHEADSICSTFGARLCTLKEILDNCTVSTGCGHNGRMIWSSTPGP